MSRLPTINELVVRAMGLENPLQAWMTGKLEALTVQADALATTPAATDSPVLPLPPGMRGLLLNILAAGYPGGAAQTRLGNAPDGAIAWQVQSMLDDYADADALQAFRAAA